MQWFLVKQLDSVVFSKHYSSRSKTWICSGINPHLEKQGWVVCASVSLLLPNISLIENWWVFWWRQAQIQMEMKGLIRAQHLCFARGQKRKRDNLSVIMIYIQYTTLPLLLWCNAPGPRRRNVGQHMSPQSRDERHIYFYQAPFSWNPSKFCLTSDVMTRLNGDPVWTQEGTAGCSRGVRSRRIWNVAPEDEKHHKM